LEARLLLSSGAWKNFDDIEEHITVDELLLLQETLIKMNYENYKFHAALQGVELDEPEFESDVRVGDELPPEVLESERKFREKLNAMTKEEELKTEFSQFGIGYQSG
jgi:hypothetical protein